LKFRLQLLRVRHGSEAPQVATLWEAAAAAGLPAPRLDAEARSDAYIHCIMVDAVPLDRCIMVEHHPLTDPSNYVSIADIMAEAGPQPAGVALIR
jgi:hypothetical protein